jgi:hypothetical protein
MEARHILDASTLGNYVAIRTSDRIHACTFCTYSRQFLLPHPSIKRPKLTHALQWPVAFWTRSLPWSLAVSLHGARNEVDETHEHLSAFHAPDARIDPRNTKVGGEADGLRFGGGGWLSLAHLEPPSRHSARKKFIITLPSK